jgi:hypothetical protein
MSTAPVSERVSGVAGLQPQRTSRIWLCSDERLDREGPDLPLRTASLRRRAPTVSLVRARSGWELIATDAVIALVVSDVTGRVVSSQQWLPPGS